MSKPKITMSKTKRDRKKSSTAPLEYPTDNHRELIRPRMISSDGGKLNKHELDLLQYAAEGDLKSLKRKFEQQTYYWFQVKVNCVDSLDRTALSLATLNHHIDVVKFLLSDEIQGLKLGDALFYAIQCEFTEAIELLLEKDPQTSLQVLPGTTSPFEPGLTPFMLAAHKNNYKILAMLYKYSHRLIFSDNELLLDEGFDPYSWDAVMERLLHYRARASPAFMLLMYNEKGMSWDPLNTTMDLFGELQELAIREREVDKAYLHMAKECEKFAMQLLQEVRSANELADFMSYDLDEDDDKMILAETNEEGIGIESSQRQNKKCYLKPIEKAVKYEMKDFVTSDNSQLALIYIQKGKLFRNLRGSKATFVEIFLGMLFPLLSLAFLFAPRSALGRLMLNPTVKFCCWLASEIVFVILLLTNTILMQYNLFSPHDSIPYILIVAYFWIMGKFIQEVREIKNQGLREYMTDIWNWNDMFSILLYTAFMILRLVHIISNGVSTNRVNQQHWHNSMWDPLRLSDICIAVSYILINWRIMELLRADRTFGPLQVSLDLMMKDAFRFLVMFSIIFLAFGSGITELYAPYGLFSNCTCNDTSVCNISLPLVQKWEPNTTDNPAVPACVACKTLGDGQIPTNFTEALQGLFWTMFGYGQPNVWYPINNCGTKYVIQEVAGGIIIGLYHIAAIIVLVNMLIAMMSNSFQKTHDDSEREWKFHRTQLWLKFIRNEINRPPPMNLIPQWKVIKASFVGLANMFRKLCKMCKTRRHNVNFNNHISNHIQMLRRRTELDEGSAGTLCEGESRYCKVLRLVVLRYVKQKVLRSEMVI